MQPMPSATQREFNGTDLFGSLFLSGSIYGGAKSKERNRTTVKKSHAAKNGARSATLGHLHKFTSSIAIIAKDGDHFSNMLKQKQMND